MDALVTMLPFAVFSVCLAFSLFFAILAAYFFNEKVFYGLSLVSIAVGLNRFALGMLHLSAVTGLYMAPFWIDLYYGSTALLAAAVLLFLFFVVKDAIKPYVVLGSSLFSLLLLGLSFTPYLGGIVPYSEGALGVDFYPTIVEVCIAVFIVVLAIFCLILPFLSSKSDVDKRDIFVTPLSFLGGLLILLAGIPHALVFIKRIPDVMVRLSSIGVVISVLSIAVLVIIRHNKIKRPLERVMIKLNEAQKLLGRKGKMAISDQLTGLYNRAFFDESIEIEVSDAIKNNRSLSLLMIDIDKFKRVNENFGYSVGDSVLSEISEVIKQNGRGSDLAARYSGEEFAVILPNTTLTDAQMAAERIRESIAKIDFIVENKPLKYITTSIGVSSLRGSDVHTDLVSRAAKALYNARKKGGNTVSIEK